MGGGGGGDRLKGRRSNKVRDEKDQNYNSGNLVGRQDFGKVDFHVFLGLHSLIR